MKLTPMMQQYVDTKAKYKDCLLFFRLGDFYELFFEDAEIASRELEITLTGRDCGFEERAPMCGVPWHSAHNYIARLINKGYKVAVCEQVEDPALAKGIVKREVIRVITPGTVTDPAMLEEKKNNFLMSIYCNKSYFGIAAADVTTGEFYATQIIFGNTYKKLIDEISRYKPSEIVINNEFEKAASINDLKEKTGVYVSVLDSEAYDRENALAEAEGKTGFDDLKKQELALCASGALLYYLNSTQKAVLSHIREIKLYSIEKYMMIDASSRRNLELTETIRERKKRGSLLWVLDRTMTAMGGRKLRKWLDQPLLDIDPINERLDAVEELKDKFMIRKETIEHLKRVYDIERLSSKLVVGNVNARDLLSLKDSILRITPIRELISGLQAKMNINILNNLDPLRDVFDIIDSSISEDAPLTLKDGGIIKTGFSDEVDKYRGAYVDGKQWIADLESREKEATGIKNLRIRFNKVFGYYIEVTNSYLSQVPDRYIRKQTLVNCERFITEELKNLEDTILGAEEKVTALEYELFCEIRAKIASQVARILNTAEQIALLDVLCSLAEVADRENYTKPAIHEGGEIKISEGRHPVVEKTLSNTPFVPNDTVLDNDSSRLIIITGPNMAGKSTYMRQVALIVLMAQIGSFVPAAEALIGLVDRIYTRVGASDDLASGQSTFMVEMMEVANILNNATPKSLLILDEIGRGTSTYDGLSIAWSVIEYINDKGRLGCRTLFATHYHELTELEDKLNGVRNCCIDVKKKGEDIIFLRKIKPGGANRSYGIEVARLAGVPQLVIDKAREIMQELDAADINKGGRYRKKNLKPLEGQMDLLTAGALSRSERDVLEELRSIDATALTPLDALNKLYSLQQKLK